MKKYFADLEAYSVSFYEKYGYIKEYAILMKDSDGNLIDEDIELFPVIQRLYYNLNYDNGENINIYFHNGGNYDLWFIIEDIIKFYSKVDYFIDEKKSIYSLKIKKVCYKGNKRKTFTISFLDTFKIWPVALKVLGKAVGLEKLDYEEYDILDEFETIEDYKLWKNGKGYEYLHRDVDIMVNFNKSMEKAGLSVDNFKLTIGATAKFKFENLNKGNFWNFKNIKGSKIEDVKTWSTLKKGYRGGLTIVKPGMELKLLHNITSFDVNSLYPAVMLNNTFPLGKIFKGHRFGATWLFYEVSIIEAETDKIPFIEREVGDNKEVHYPRKLKYITKYMDNTMLSLFEKYYKGSWSKKILYSAYERGNIFNEYIDLFRNLKEKNKGAVRLVAKLFLNSLYGKFGQKIGDIQSVIKYKEDIPKNDIIDTGKTLWLKVNKDKRVRLTSIGDFYIYKEENDIKNINTWSYIPIAIKITSLARSVLVNAINNNYENFIYADTDSIHLTTSNPKGIVLDENNFGDWKNEGTWKDAVYRRPKHYYHINSEDEYELKGGGFIVQNFNPKNLPMDLYRKETFTIPNGKRIKILVEGKPLIIDKDYTFESPIKEKDNE